MVVPTEYWYDILGSRTFFKKPKQQKRTARVCAQSILDSLPKQEQLSALLWPRYL